MPLYTTNLNIIRYSLTMLSTFFYFSRKYSFIKRMEIKNLEKMKKWEKIKKKEKYWRCRDLNPGLSACEADTLPLSYIPTVSEIVRKCHFSKCSKLFHLTFSLISLASIKS